MKIENQNQSQSCKFSELIGGQTFYAGDTEWLFMRCMDVVIRGVKTVVFNAVRLSDGQLELYDPDQSVRLANTKVIVT